MADARTILLIDDDQEVLQALRVMLEGHGYRVVTAPDGESGIEAAEREAPDVAVVDMMMPRKSGFLVLEHLKREGMVGPKVIIMTAIEGSQHRAYAETLGADDYLQKPFGMERLLGSIRQCLG